MAKSVAVIPAKPTFEIRGLQQTVKLRVCAYCRVSTDSEEQLTSYQAQMQHYLEYISQNPSWEFSGIYADEGISGTSTKNRTQFNKLIKDCKGRKVDLVLTKSISRFARNTLDCLKYIRLLKEYGVAVFFEKENVNTLDSKGEFLLTLLSSLAQEESRSVSTNTKWGIAHKFQQGEVMINHTQFLGYTKDDKGNLVVVPSEGIIVKRIYKDYLEGKSAKQIARELTGDKIKAPAGGSKWFDSTILSILKNEKYYGDAILQKGYTEDFLTKKRVKNMGQLPQYYIEENHEGIISKEVFMKVQEEILRRNNLPGASKGGTMTYQSKFALSHRIVCSHCGTTFRRCGWVLKGENVKVWRCGKRLATAGKECRAEAIREDALQQAFIDAMNELIQNHQTFIEPLLENIEKVLSQEKQGCSMIEARIEELSKILTRMVENQSRRSRATNISEEEYVSISNEYTGLVKQQEENKAKEKACVMRKLQIKEFLEILTSKGEVVTEYEDKLLRQLVERVHALENKKVRFEFKCGIQITKNL
ncbi:MAG: recombinase family protein [Cellulosilyticaceae bacterium]